jgi:hypothetical protein
MGDVEVAGLILARDAGGSGTSLESINLKDSIENLTFV